MSDLRKVVIEIKQVNADGTPKSPEGGQADAGKTEINIEYIIHPIQYIEKQTIGKNVLAFEAYSQAKRLLSQAVTSSVNRYFSMKEDYKTEVIYSNVTTAVNKVASFGASIAGGAIMGGKLGPYGAIAGATISAVSWGVSETISGYNSVANYRASMNESNMQASFMGARYGLVDGGHGTEN